MAYPNLNAEMTRRNISDKDIAKVVGRSADTVRNWRNGKGEFPIGKALEVQEVLFPMCPIAYLFSKVAITLSTKYDQ